MDIDGNFDKSAILNRFGAFLNVFFQLTAVKKRLLGLVYALAYHTGLIHLFYLGGRKRQVILTYHNVISDDLFDETAIHLGVSCTASTFKKHLDIILARFKVSTELGLSGTCMITFDDGYRNNLDIAARLLNERNVSGLFFVPACYFEGHSILWIDKLLMWFSYAPAGNYLIAGQMIAIDLDPGSRQRLWGRIYDHVLDDYSEIDSLLDQLDRAFPFADIIKSVPENMFQQRFVGLSADEVNALKVRGNKVGCHSFRHDILSKLDGAKLDSDFARCARHSAIYNSSIYSYPFGGVQEVSPSVIRACENYGYSGAVLNYDCSAGDRFSVGRISLDNLVNRYFIEARLSGFEKFIKGVLRSRTRPEPSH